MIWSTRRCGHRCDYLAERLIEPQVAITLCLSIALMAAWMLLKRGITRLILFVTAAAVVCYLALVTLIIASGVAHLVEHPELFQSWVDAIFAGPTPMEEAPAGETDWIWAWLGIALWSFPQMALGLSGFEMILTVVTRVRGGAADTPEGRIRNTRKLMLTAAAIMAVYLVSSVLVTTLYVPREVLGPGGEAEHRALAYLAHGMPLVEQAGDAPLNSLFGHDFGDLFDLSTALVLCLAGATVTLGLQNMLPHYLNRLGMDVSWAGRLEVILVVLNVVVLVVTIVFKASPSSQQWAYATSVLVLIAGASLAAAMDLGSTLRQASRRLIGLRVVRAGGWIFPGDGRADGARQSVRAGDRHGVRGRDSR